MCNFAFACFIFTNVNLYNLRNLQRGLGYAVAIFCFATLLALASSAQAIDASENNAALPDAPSSLISSSSADSFFSPPKVTTDVAKKYHRIVNAGQQAVPLTSGDKFVLALADRASITAVAGSAFSAGYGYWLNETPHYGTNLPAYGQRFGAAELKATSESVLSYGLYASVFHDDPRYYVMGPQEKIMKRAVYSASRVVITRKDDGNSAVNWSKLAGLTSAAALTNAYYPDQDRRFGRTATSVLTSIATTAGVNELHEFIGGAVRLVFHKHQADK